MKQKYRYLLFDADHTVLNFDEDEKRAFRVAFQTVGKDVSDEEIERCWVRSAECWQEVGLNDVHSLEVQETWHALYDRHILHLFDWVDTVYGLNETRMRAQLAFEEALSLPSHYIERADELLEQLALKGYRVCIATNGLSRLQHGRMEKIKPFLHGLFISEEVGAIKPTAVYFQRVLSALGAKAEECVMIGDSLTSDMAGAHGADIDCIWLNRDGRTPPPYVKGKISSLWEVEKFI